MKEVSRNLALLNHLHHLELFQFPFDPGSFDVISRMSQLEYLGLPYDSTDESLEMIRKLKNLRFLNASGTKISGAGLSFLADLPCLESLDLRGTTLDIDSLGGLEKLKSLKILLLAFSNVSDRHLENARFPETLRSLTLHQTAISNGSIRFLTQLNGLEYLSIYDTMITDQGLAELTEYPGLVLDRNIPPTDSNVVHRMYRLQAFQGHVTSQYYVAALDRESNPSMSLMWYYLCRYQQEALNPLPRKNLPNQIATLEKKLSSSQIQWAQLNATALREIQHNAEFRNPIVRDYNLPVYQIRFETITRPDISNPCNP
jgi:hypothetical protein